MGRTIKTKVKFEDIYFDEELYPRSIYNWQTAYDYSQSIRAGIKFPPIILAMLNGKKYLVDGKHRAEANKLLKNEKIEAIVHTGWNRRRIFEEAVKANISHGRGLSPYEKRRIALKLREMSLSEEEISKLIQIPMDKLENFVGDRLVNTLTGVIIDPEEQEQSSREIGQAILKSGIKHYAGAMVTAQDLASINKNQKSFSMNSQENLLSMVVKIIETNMLDTSNKKVMVLVWKLKNLINRL